MLLSSISVFGIKNARAQEVIPTYSDYLTDNLYLLYPSMAGASNYNQIRLTARQQWFDVQDAPNLQTLSVNGRVGDKVGLGGIFFRDENGYFSKLGAYGTFAYHLMFSRDNVNLNQLSFGISADIIQHRLDQSQFTVFDPLIGGSNATDFFANMDLGMSYYYMDFYAHIAAKNIISVERDLFYSEELPSNQRKYMASAGYVFDFYRDDWGLEPSFLFQLREQNSQSSIDANLKAYKDFDFGQGWIGASYRHSFDASEYNRAGEEVERQSLKYITPFLGVEYKQFIFGYTFSYQLNTMVLSNSGFHQLTLGYNFGKNRERYDCHCPAIN
ncbi:PorP/SprF family type IX secretion system membrane protein [Zunongwangia endophytica]|uniref:PorP/SprF family type IX secretion system membrane protein n=1 Tax=Zunongwangia endophytica TaxID=1808945 RepID=UPI0025B5D464|nr:type IX secretion system membrane protein PorP/SprF [Zunongwangia endophytica]MDN3596299.1 type IX secretion system membrane protein PorP/SprF [Zunongwangia endophytica]